MTRLIALLAVIVLLPSCKSHERLETTASDTTSSFHLEKTEGVSISSSDIRQWHWGERIHTLVLNEKGDTVRERELVYVNDNSVEIYKDSLLQLREAIDSLRNIKSKHIYIKEEKKLPLWKEILIYYSAFIIVALLAIIVVLFLYIRYLLRQKEKK